VRDDQDDLDGAVREQEDAAEQYRLTSQTVGRVEQTVIPTKPASSSGLRPIRSTRAMAIRLP
jgi:hypothetical protein